MTHSSHGAFIGDGESGGASFDGRVDELRIYDRALSAAELGELARR